MQRLRILGLSNIVGPFFFEISKDFFVICFSFKEKQEQIQIQKKTYDLHIHFFLDKRHLTYKTKDNIRCIYVLHVQTTTF